MFKNVNKLQSIYVRENIRDAKKRVVQSRRRSICVTGQYVRVESRAKSREFRMLLVTVIILFEAK